MHGERMTTPPVPQPPRGWTVTHRHGHTWIKQDGNPTEVCIWFDDRGFRHVYDGEYSHTAEEARRIGMALVAAAGVLEFLERQMAEETEAVLGTTTCSECGGAGETGTHGACPKCRGTGREPEKADPEKFWKSYDPDSPLPVFRPEDLERAVRGTPTYAVSQRTFDWMKEQGWIDEDGAWLDRETAQRLGLRPEQMVEGWPEEAERDPRNNRGSETGDGG